MPVGLRVMPLWRMSLSRKVVRMSPANESVFWLSAAFMSTCNMKCTPPRKSSPKYMGAACKADSHAGERDNKFSATTKPLSLPSGTKAF